MLTETARKAGHLRRNSVQIQEVTGLQVKIKSEEEAQVQSNNHTDDHMDVDVQNVEIVVIQPNTRLPCTEEKTGNFDSQFLELCQENPSLENAVSLPGFQPPFDWMFRNSLLPLSVNPP
ncbi:unnamed protein product [Darwinula stevensoni]|uniref:Uncharacterized protein n=1 Tax=Darwinula stevensoni TaxID=69355 RepID=A0A7R8XDQ0_9CRUS|nr:unnamed protein product [Darwinula stevensoni]CAG0893279.1 unnamed protein product [Darwinula stevensoni]